LQEQLVVVPGPGGRGPARSVGPRVPGNAQAGRQVVVGDGEILGPSRVAILQDVRGLGRDERAADLGVKIVAGQATSGGFEKVGAQDLESLLLPRGKNGPRVERVR